VLFFEADAGRRQIGGVDQPDRQFPPGIALDQRRQQILVDLPQSRHAETGSEFVQHAYVGHSALSAQPGKLSPSRLFRQQGHQEIHRMHRREQAQ
jgi:hypothetical protein